MKRKGLFSFPVSLCPERVKDRFVAGNILGLEIRRGGNFFFGIEIAIGIGIDPISRGFHPHRMTYSFDFDLDYPNG